jgi:crotonobetainyl-CoA:carnitine CoA-transferase CaiB-like acyl-CoA transferase
MEEPIAHFFCEITKSEFFDEVIKRDMLGYPVATAAEILKDPQLHARGFWQKIDHPELGTSLTYPGIFGSFSGAPCRIGCRAPLIGEHNQEIYCGELGLKASDIMELEERGIV